MVGCKFHGTAKNPADTYQQRCKRAASIYGLFTFNQLGQFDVLVIGRTHRVGGLLKRDQERVVVSCLCPGTFQFVLFGKQPIETNHLCIEEA